MAEAADFFISYTGADRAWAEWVAWQLEQAGYSVIVQAWDFEPGDNFVVRMRDALEQADRTLALVSAAYLASPYCTDEWTGAFLHDPEGRNRLLQIRIEACDLPRLLRAQVYIDLVGLPAQQAKERLLAEVIRGRRKPTGEPPFPTGHRGPLFPGLRIETTNSRSGQQDLLGQNGPRNDPGALPPVWNVPFRRNSEFTGREGALASLAEQLGRGAAVAVTQVLQGSGGIGKTAIATEYAYRHRSEFDTVWWVRAEEPATLIGDYAGLASTLGLPEADQADQLTTAAVRRWLQGHDRWLLILDNAAAPDTTTGLQAPLAQVIDLLPQVLHGQVLVTSRDASWEQHAALSELDVFTSEEAVTFLLARSGSSDQATATAVVELLGFLPLALEQAGAYVRETRMPLSRYLDRLSQYPKLILTKGRPRHHDPADTVATTWQVSLEKIRSAPGTAALLEVCAFLGAEAIPRDLFAQPLDPPARELALFTEDPLALDETVGTLRRFGLVKANEQALSIHRLLQQVIRDQLDPIASAASVAIAVRLTAAALPEGLYIDPDLWPLCARLLPHSLAVAQHAEELEVELLLTASVLTSTADYLWSRARYTEARTLHERALAIRRTRLGPTHLDTAESHTGLGIALADHGDLDTSRIHLERALDIQEHRLGAGHPDTVNGLTNLAGVLHLQGDFDGARSLIERALAISEAHLGADHPDTAQCLNNLAEVLRAQGDHSAVRSLYERSVAILEAHLGADHRRTALTLSNLAEYLLTQGELAAARSRIERARMTFESRLGPDHTDTARAISILAEVLRAQEDLEGACFLVERALEIREARLGPDHPDTVSSRQALAAIVAELDSRQPD